LGVGDGVGVGVVMTGGVDGAAAAITGAPNPAQAQANATKMSDAANHPAYRRPFRRVTSITL
jgi:hypothetical protein